MRAGEKAGSSPERSAIIRLAVSAPSAFPPETWAGSTQEGIWPVAAFRAGAKSKPGKRLFRVPCAAASMVASIESFGFCCVILGQVLGAAGRFASCMAMFIIAAALAGRPENACSLSTERRAFDSASFRCRT
ncbi:hypothetical protein [Streptosporangium roseum]|uniref:hypothetical protein n=1 Tax=Streptosporangium roseum TaxID=2001 RepID=UPI0033235F87